MADMSDDPRSLDATAAHMRQTEPAIAEDHFTAAVLVQISRPRELPTWVSNTMLLGATALGSAILAWQIPLTDLTSLLNAATTNLPAVLIAAAVSSYGGALAAIWAADR
jgi:hypothetical protein